MRVVVPIAIAASVITLAGESRAAGSQFLCDEVDCSAVLPAAKRFAAVEGTPYAAGFNAADEPVGWVARSTDVVDIRAYSGKPLVTLIGLDTEGRIAGAKLLKHGEPILLTGIPERLLHEFVAFYPGKPAASRIVVGTSTGKADYAVDVISGATVTALAQNQTIMQVARTVGTDMGILDPADVSPGHFVTSDVPWTWQQMERAGIFGRLTVTEEQMKVRLPEGNFIDLWFTIADAPQVGRPLIGDGTYEFLKEQLKPGEHLFVVLGNGSNSFKGSAFVRGGIFDRIRIEQGFKELTFRDTDYHSVSTVYAEGAPEFKEGAVFVSRSAKIDPGASFDMVFLGSRYNRRGAFTRDYVEFRSSFKLPKSLYVVERTSFDEPTYVQAWRGRWLDIFLLLAVLHIIIVIFYARTWTTGSLQRIKKLHVAVLVLSFVVLGLYLRAQPSVTQLLTLVDGIVHELRFELFASDPMLFISWTFIAIVTIVWGRGVFCGWACPYGAAAELANLLARKLRLPQLKLPDKLKYTRYLVLAVLIAVFLYDPIMGEKAAEIEPFKTSFFVVPWTRHWGLLTWFLILGVASLFVFRPFCRFLCPLGAGLSILSSVRRSGPRRRRFCTKCSICAKGCEYDAIRPNGSIDPRECFSCMDCEAIYRDKTRCPPLIGIERLKARRGKWKRADSERFIRLKDERKRT